jgi:hypothetical protein
MTHPRAALQEVAAPAMPTTWEDPLDPSEAVSRGGGERLIESVSNSYWPNFGSLIDGALR